MQLRAVFKRLRRSRILGSDRGQSLIEFAIASLLFLVLLFGILEFSRAIFYHNALANLAREGARFAIVRGADSGRAVDEAAVRTFVQGRAVGLTPTVSVTWTPDNTPGSTVRVQLNHTFNSVVPLVWVRTIAMSAVSRMTVLR